MVCITFPWMSYLGISAVWCNARFWLYDIFGTVINWPFQKFLAIETRIKSFANRAILTRQLSSGSLCQTAIWYRFVNFIVVHSVWFASRKQRHHGICIFYYRDIMSKQSLRFCWNICARTTAGINEKHGQIYKKVKIKSFLKYSFFFRIFLF